MYDKCVSFLASRGVTIHDIAQCVLFLQKDYHPELSETVCEKVIKEVLHKREVQHAVITGICLDIAAEQNKLADEQLTDILKIDSPLYGIDEVLAYGICNLYGSIALTNYGYIDRCKPGIIRQLNVHREQCNTFLDDIVGAIAAAAAGKLAHSL